MIEIVDPAEKARLLPTTGLTDNAPTDSISSSSSEPPAYVAREDVERQQIPQQYASPNQYKSKATSRFIKALVLSFIIYFAIWATFHLSFELDGPSDSPHSPGGDRPDPSHDPGLPPSDTPTDSHGSLSWSQPARRHDPNQDHVYYASSTPLYDLNEADLQLIRVLGPQSAGSIVYKGVNTKMNHAKVFVEARWEEHMGSSWGISELSRVDGGLCSTRKSKTTEFSLLTKEPHPASDHPGSPSGQLQFHLTVLIPIDLKMDSTRLAFEGNVFSTVYDSLRSTRLGGLSVQINAGSITADEVISTRTNFTINTGSIYGTYRPLSDFFVQINSGSVHTSLFFPPSTSSLTLSPPVSSSISTVQSIKPPTHQIYINTGSIELKYFSISPSLSPHINLTSNSGNIHLRMPDSFKGSYDAVSSMGSVEVIDEKRTGLVKEDGTATTWTGKRTWGWIGEERQGDKRERKKKEEGEGSVSANVHIGSISFVVV